MKINGKDISEYGARQWNVTPAFSSIDNKSQWIEGAAMPLLLKAEIGMKKIKVSVMLEGERRDAIWSNARRLVADLLSPAEIELDGFQNLYHMVLANASSAEISLQKFHKATLELVGYEHGQEIAVFGSGKQIHIQNPGNAETPVVVEITPLIGKAGLVINGIVRDRYTQADKPITVRKITQGNIIILDGEKGLFTEAGLNKLGDIDVWGLPSLCPGNNLIQINQNDMQVNIRYKPRYV